MHAGIAYLRFPLTSMEVKRSRHSRRMHNPWFRVSGKRPMGHPHIKLVRWWSIRIFRIGYLAAVRRGWPVLWETPLCIKFKSYFLFPGPQRGPQYQHIFFINVKNIIWMAQPTSTKTRRFITWMKFVRQILLKLDTSCIPDFRQSRLDFPLGVIKASMQGPLNEHSSLSSIVVVEYLFKCHQLQCQPLEAYEALPHIHTMKNSVENYTRITTLRNHESYHQC